MITQETIQKLNDMRLDTMAKVRMEIQQTAPGNALSFEEKIGMLVDREWTDRDNRRLEPRLKEAKLGTGRASLEDVLVDLARGIDKATIRTTQVAIRLRSLRDTGITWRLWRGDNPFIVQRLAGHKRFSTTEKYVGDIEKLSPECGQPFPGLPKILVSGASMPGTAAAPVEGRR